MEFNGTARGWEPSGGFSLIEIMVATFIASLMFIMVATSYRSITKAVKDLTGHAEFYENINMALARIDRDVTNMHRNPDSKSAALVATVEKENGNINFITVDHQEMMVRGGISQSFPMSDVREVGYHLREDGQIPGIFRLVRREQVPYDADIETGGTESVILDNVVSLRFQYLMGNDFTDAWDSRETRRFPRAIRIILEAKDYRGENEIFESMMTMGAPE